MVRIINLLTVLCVSLPAWACPEVGNIWLDIDTHSATLRVMNGPVEQTRFDNIAIGRFGTTRSKRTGDNKTPLGRFNIAWIKENSRFHLFLGLDYPTMKHASRAFRAGRINRDTWQDIRRAFATDQTPPQGTTLGGHIGIHGIGAGDPRIHEGLNWTNGCIALTNEQIDSLKKWVDIGTPVTIH